MEYTRKDLVKELTDPSGYDCSDDLVEDAVDRFWQENLGDVDAGQPDKMIGHELETDAEAIYTESKYWTPPTMDNFLGYNDRERLQELGYEGDG